MNSVFPPTLARMTPTKISPPQPTPGLRERSGRITRAEIQLLTRQPEQQRRRIVLQLLCATASPWMQDELPSSHEKPGQPRHIA